jgi:cellulose synthase/poly-beta-1,6-N-acetylglucosamine synthase-like glycosyltransferase
MSVLVSAVIATYNRADLVQQAIRSALEQHVPGGEVEVIVVDDASTDNTPEVVPGFGPGVRFVRQAHNQREGAARNAGVRLAAGAYCAFLDSDDFWLPGKLAADVARFEAPDRPALVYSRALNVGARGEHLSVRYLPSPQGDVFWALAREAFMPMSSVAVRTDAFRACGGFCEDAALSGTADWELWMRLTARWPVGFVEQTATCIRVHAQHMLADPAYMERAMLAGVRHALADPVVAARARGRERFIQACMCVTIALNAYANGRRKRTWHWLARAATTWPPQVVDPRFVGATARAVLGPAAVRRLKPIAA